jgi:hypothetical protein
MLRQTLGKASCKVGKHAGEWRLVSPTQCDLVRVCSRPGCGVEERKVDHEGWTAWEFASAGEDDCTLQRVCTRCETPELGKRHDWGAWEYLRAGECDAKRVCNRCDARETDERHAEVENVYIEAEKCRQHGVCSRCGIVLNPWVREPEVHVWGQYEFTPERNSAVRVCGRCGHVEERERDTAGAAPAARGA